MSDSTDLRNIVAELRKQGWDCKLSPNARRWTAQPPANAPKSHQALTFAADPGSVVNVIRDLRQRGFVWPPPKKAELLHARLSEMLSENGVEPRITSTPFPPQPNPDVQVIVSNGAAKALGHKKPGPQLPPPQDVDRKPRFTFHDAKPTAAALPPDSEQLFAQLKEAKEHARLAGAYLQECETQRDQAQIAVDAAAREHEEALLAYKAARERFDKAFELE